MSFKFISSIIVIFLAYSTLCEIHVGSFIKDSFKMNDARIDRAFRLAKEKILSLNDGSQKIQVIPIAVYHQIVNGINYKIITATKNKDTLKVDLQQTDIYTDPFTEEITFNNYSISSSENLHASKNLQLEDTTKVGIMSSVYKVLKVNDSKLVKINHITTYPNVLFDESYYLVLADTSKGNVSSQKIFVISNIEGEDYQVETQINLD